MKSILKKATASFIFALASAVFWGRVLKPKKHRGAPPQLSSCNSVLVVKLDAIGDLVLTTPLLEAIKAASPQARITLVIKSVSRELLEKCPYVDEIIIFDAAVPNSIKGSSTLAWVWPRWSAYKFGREKLRNRKFDLALVPRFDMDEIAAAWLVGGANPRFSVAHSESATPVKAQFNPGYDNFYDYPLKSKVSIAHEVERNLELLDVLLPEPAPRNATRLWFDDADWQKVDSFWKEHNLAKFDYVVAVVPGSRIAKKEWGEANFQQTISFLMKSDNVAVLVMGGPQEKEMAERLAAIDERVFNMAGVLSLRQSFCVLERCALYVGCDTASKHFAAAAKVPVIEVSCHPIDGDPSNHHSPLRFGAWMVPSHVVRPAKALAPCVDKCDFETPHCITQISVASVQDAITEFWPAVEKRRQDLLCGAPKS